MPAAQRHHGWRSGLYHQNLAGAESRNILRATGRFVALSCLLLSGGSVLLMFTTGGPAATPARIATTVVAVAATVAAALWWIKGWPRVRTSLTFVLAAELGQALGLLTCSDPVVSLLGATWFFLIGDDIAFAHGRQVLLLHCVWVKANLLYFGILALLQPGTDAAFVIFLVIGLTATLIVSRLFSQVFSDALRSDSDRSSELAHRDPMTMLLNRRGLDAMAPQVFGPDAGEVDMVAVILIDVDRFKAVNDLHGHLAGDAVLQLLAQRLANSVRALGLVARTGGEEFVVLDRVHTDGIRAMAERLRTVCADAGDPVPISVSVGAVGLAMDPLPTGDPGLLLTDLIIRADAAMYAATQRGGDRVAFDLTPAVVTTPSAASKLGPSPDEIFDRVLASRARLQRRIAQGDGRGAA